MKAFIVYGTSGSGKTTKAKEIIQNRCADEDVWFDYGSHIERDNIRFEWLNLGNWKTYKHDHRTEAVVDAIWKYKIVHCAQSESDIIISDTLCKLSDRVNLCSLLQRLGYKEIELIQMQTSLEDCITRDAQRGDFSVGEEVIRKQYANLTKNV
jgi:predicted kinase